MIFGGWNYLASVLVANGDLDGLEGVEDVELRED